MPYAAFERIPRSRWQRAAPAVATIIAIAGCASAPSPAPPTLAVESVSFATELGVDLGASVRLASGIFYRDLRLGTGEVADTGSAVTITYSGSLPEGREFDATRPGDAPLAFRIARGRPRPISGLEQGMVGMRVGGARQIIIPPHLGYGARGSDPVPPNSPLVFTVELLGIR